MKNNLSYIDKKKVTILKGKDENFDEELPEEIDFSKLRTIENPLQKAVNVTLDSDIANHFKSSKHLNQFLRLQLKSLAILK
ncbi:MAG: hypothetical protein RO257_01795 [Candidatus Kapabacteria bacterium]|nr:hypothetical protein [Candidatus Kapabacteria bacterium]